MRKEKVSFMTSGGWNHKVHGEAEQEISNFYFILCLYCLNSNEH